MDAPPTTNPDVTLAFEELNHLAGNHVTEEGRDNCFAWRQRVANLIPADGSGEGEGTAAAAGACVRQRSRRADRGGDDALLRRPAEGEGLRG
eukprot:COSAG05_NODE_1808_length_4041_cov_7733.319127_4_plen_92_part_00